MCLSSRNLSRTAQKLPYLLVFLFLFVCNVLTKYMVDDFAYLYSFRTGQRIASVFDIFPSMAAHAQYMNGRLIPHFLVQLFTLPPAWVFDLVNAGMFILQIWTIVRVAGGGYTWKEPILCLFAFFTLWLYEPMFGQVNLWQDGAVNYLWSVVFGLGFLSLFARAYLHGEEAPPKKKIYFLLAFAAGAYSETVSAAAIFMAAVLVLLRAIEHQKAPEKYLISLICVAFLGYVSIYLAPAQWANKFAGSGGMLESFKGALRMYMDFRILLVAFFVLFIYNLSVGASHRQLLLACTLLAGSLVANFMMTFASYYPSRSACGACVFLIAADAVLLSPMLSLKKQPLILSVTLLFLLSGLGKLPEGTRDIYSTYRQMQANEALIAEKKAEGETDLLLPMVISSTKYSGLYNLRYLETLTPDTWPNDSMSRYYGVNSILGYFQDE